MGIFPVVCPAFLLLVFCASAHAQFGAIQGFVTAEDGAPIPDAVVFYSRLAQLARIGGRVGPAPGEAVVHRSVSTSAGGGFAVPDLPVGDYLFCAEVDSAPYLNPCKWSSSPKVTLLAGAARDQTLVLKKGVFLKVRVNDPLGLLPRVKDSPLGPLNLIIGVVFGEGAFLRATNVSVDQAGRDYQMAIPAGMPLKLWVFSRHVTVADSRGLPVDISGAKVPFQAIAGQDQLFTLTVSGRAPQAP